MNKNTMKGDWKVIRGKGRERWGKLTDNDWDVVAGQRGQRPTMMNKASRNVEMLGAADSLRRT